MTTGEPSAAPGWVAVEAAAEAFERAYAAAGGADPAGFCPPAGDPLHVPVAAELVRAALEFAARDGRPKRLADYAAAFPALFADPAALAGVAFEEFRLRRQAGEPVAMRSREAGGRPLHGVGQTSSRLEHAVERLDKPAVAVAAHPEGALAQGREQVERLGRERPRGYVAVEHDEVDTDRVDVGEHRL